LLRRGIWHDLYANRHFGQFRKDLASVIIHGNCSAKGKIMPSTVTEIPAASPEATAAYYARKLAFETDCWDVHAATVSNNADFVLLDVRSPALFAQSHVPSAINLPHGKMTARRMAEWPQDTLFVVYCTGPHCNGTDKAALRLACLGLSVKVMIGGMTGWADEGFAFETSPADAAAA
jgi:rhodanese-related sulfurtransferase